MRRKLAWTAAVVAAVLGALAIRAVWEGRGALHAGDEAAARGDREAAVEGWRRAARWYLPLAPHVGDAYDRLERLARDAEDAGDPDTALAAWRGVRSSALATRWLVIPHDDRRRRADRRIAALMAAAPVGAEGEAGAGAAPDAGDTPQAREAFYLGQLARDEAPSTPWTLVALGGLALLVGGCVQFARTGLDAEDRLVRRAAASAGGMALLGVLGWIVGLALA